MKEEIENVRKMQRGREKAIEEDSITEKGKWAVIKKEDSEGQMKQLLVLSPVDREKVHSFFPNGHKTLKPQHVNCGLACLIGFNIFIAFFNHIY